MSAGDTPHKTYILRTVARDERAHRSQEYRGAPWHCHHHAVTGTARVVEGGAPEVLQRLTAAPAPDAVGQFPPADAPAGYLTRITIDKVTGVGPLA